MGLSKRQLEEEMLALSAPNRAMLADKLLSSLDFPGQPEIDEEWRREVESRIDAYERGSIKAITEKDAYHSIEKRFEE